jgi:hypothetical protein
MMVGEMMLPKGGTFGAVTKSWVQNHAGFPHDSRPLERLPAFGGFSNSHLFISFGYSPKLFGRKTTKAQFTTETLRHRVQTCKREGRGDRGGAFATEVTECQAEGTEGNADLCGLRIVLGALCDPTKTANP